MLHMYSPKSVSMHYCWFLLKYYLLLSMKHYSLLMVVCPICEASIGAIKGNSCCWLTSAYMFKCSTKHGTHKSPQSKQRASHGITTWA